MIEIMSTIMRYLEPVICRLDNLIARGDVTSSSDSSGTQTIDGDYFDEESLDGLEFVENYGFTSRPLDGADSLALFHSGSRDNGMVIAVSDRRYRLTALEKGEVALYTDEGDKIHIKRGGTIEVIGATKVSVQAPDVDLDCDNANINASAVNLGSGAAEAVIKGDTFKTLFDAHTHNGNLGAPTGPPITPLDPSALSTVSTTE